MNKPIYNRFLHFFALIAGILLLAPPLAAQVDRVELGDLGPVEFINYVGPYSRFETRAQIRDIGYSLGQIVRAVDERSGALGRYFVIHSVSEPDENKLDADIFGLGVDVGVDHIRNMRFIIQGYLEAAYDYSESDAALLAEYITIYNAVYRGDWDFFSSRYKNPVMDNLSRERVGLSLRYDEWPGQTLMLIPLGTGLGGPLSAIDTAAISDARVVEQLRQEPDMGLEQRRDMVDLMEREAEQAEQQAAITREAIEQEEQRIAQERQQAAQQQEEARLEQERIAQERQQADADQQALDERQREAEQQAEEAWAQQEELRQQQEALEEQRREAEMQEAFAEQRSEEAQLGRQEIAEDMQSIIIQDIPPASAGGILGVSILSPGSYLGQLVLLDPNTGRENMRSPLNTVNARTVTWLNNRILAIAGEARGSGAIRLVEISSGSLEMLKQGDDDIAPDSLLWASGQDLYAVVTADGRLYLARFNADLVLQARSSVSVHSFASVLFSDGFIVTQRADGSAVLLNPRDMSERR